MPDTQIKLKVAEAIGGDFYKKSRKKCSGETFCFRKSLTDRR